MPEKSNILKECLTDFKSNTGYNFTELLQDKNKFRSFIEEDRKKDLIEYSEKSRLSLINIEKIYNDLIFDNQV
jgi:hypothetical protein